MAELDMSWQPCIMKQPPGYNDPFKSFAYHNRMGHFNESRKKRDTESGYYVFDSSDKKVTAYKKEADCKKALGFKGRRVYQAVYGQSLADGRYLIGRSESDVLQLAKDRNLI
jgi:hypothetical protein